MTLHRIEDILNGDASLHFPEGRISIDSIAETPSN